MIDIIYAGQKGFYNITEPTHIKLFDRIKSLSEINVNWFTKPNPERGHCPYDNTEARGAVQVWDLLDSLEKTDNEIFIKLRTDIFFTSASIDAVFEELRFILENKQDLSFLGWMYKDWDFNSPYYKESVQGLNHIQDFVIIGKKSKLADKNIVFERLNSRPMSKNISGNKTFNDIIDNKERAFTVKTHMYLCRKDYKKFNEHQLAIDYFDAYAKGKAKDYKEWYLKNVKKS